jgi:hypothetical protein
LIEVVFIRSIGTQVRDMAMSGESIPREGMMMAGIAEGNAAGNREKAGHLKPFHRLE